jgi:cytoskeletal protein RodZ
MTNDDEWRSIRRDANRAGRFSLGWVGVIVAAVLLLGAAVWGISVAVSPAKGRGDAYQQKNSAASWTQAQAEFEDNYAEIVSADQRIGVAAKALSANPKDGKLNTEYTGIQNYCLQVVADYNADSRKYLKADFKSADLPYQIDLSDPATDCKE